MHTSYAIFRIRSVTGIIFAGLALSGCLSNENDAITGGETETDHELSGSVGDGPVVGASMRVLRNDGVELAQLESDSGANFNITVRTRGTYYPLTIEARSGTDLVTNLAPDFEMYGAVLEPGNRSVANVNPFSTVAVEIARDLPGGANKANLQTGERIASSELNSGLSSLVPNGAMWSRIDENNIAEIVRASEALGETVRRTRDTLSGVGISSSGDSVLRAIASDLIDDVVDGRGGARADARTAAVGVVVYAQVLIETMAGELQVNGQNATAAMNGSIAQVLGTSPATLVNDVAVTAEMIVKARIGLAAAHAVTQDPAIADLHAAVSGIQAGMEPSFINSLLPANYRGRMTGAIAMVASGSAFVVEQVNETSRSRNGELSNVANRPPVISGTPPNQVVSGTQYRFVPTASDPDGDTLSFSISNLPTWASFDATTGELSGTPARTDGGTYSGIVISVSDGTLSDSLIAFAITVAVNNSAPQISGTPPPDVTVDQAYSFTPNASDPDGDPLTFSVTNLPPWAGFDTATGALTGTPQAGDEAVYAGIEIRATDGLASASIGPFDVTVNAVALGSVTLIWTPPTQNDDGSTLTDLAGYRIYWGTTPGNYPNWVTINNPGISSFVVDNLSPGTYEFVATSLNSAGMESAYSNTTSKIVP